MYIYIYVHTRAMYIPKIGWLNSQHTQKNPPYKKNDGIGGAKLLKPNPGVCNPCIWK